jgi:hypothetical protein
MLSSYVLFETNTYLSRCSNAIDRPDIPVVAARRSVRIESTQGSEEGSDQRCIVIMSNGL